MASSSQSDSFSALGLSQPLLTVLAERGYRAPTPVQAQAIPPLLAGKDLIARARTGSGKTAAFAIPLLERLDMDQRQPQALVLCPTRDLCNQVAAELRALGRYRPNLQVLVVAGGQPVGPQAQALQRGVHVVVATPGRLLDHLRRASLSGASLAQVVLDEADRMLDMGFREEVDAILARLAPTRQTALFSATFPADVEALCDRYQREPERVELAAAAPQIEQWRLELELAQRAAALPALLAKRLADGVIVFCNTKQQVDELAEQLQAAGLAAERLHGGLEQPERDLAMARFRNGSSLVLVATDVAARGLDIAELGAVINFELPWEPEVYVHRIGRSGRAGKPGLAISLHAAAERGRLEAIEAYTGREIALRQALPQAAPPPQPLWRTLLIAGGRQDKIRPGDILGALTGEAGLQAEQVGRIEVGQRVSYVAVARELAVPALKRLRDGKIKGRRFRIHLPR